MRGLVMRQGVERQNGRTTTALRARLEREPIARAIGGNDGLVGMLAERHGFDAVWASGLAISTSHGVPDAGILTMTELLAAAQVMTRSTTLPVLADCDTGFGDVNVVTRMVQEYETAGIAGVCIEDKEFPKRNSFTTGQELAEPQAFADKLQAAKQAQTDPDSWWWDASSPSSPARTCRTRSCARPATRKPAPTPS